MVSASGTATSLTGPVLAGTLRSTVGARVMYWASGLLGRPLVLRYGRFAPKETWRYLAGAGAPQAS